MQNNIKRKPMVWIETGFDIIYLGIVLISGILLIQSAIGSERWLFGLMALILGAGDAVHLLPRIHAMWDSEAKPHVSALGIGKLAASVTMTVFYVILWHIGIVRYPGIIPGYITAVIYGLAVIRIVLCLFPQNGWTIESPSLKWAIWRNIPFFLLGMSVMVLFAKNSFTYGNGLPFLWIAILISFACYFPVVLLSGKSRKVGMLMLPKSCAYAAIVLMGFSLAVS